MLWRKTLGTWVEEDGGSRLLWRRAGCGRQRGFRLAGTVMPRMVCPCLQQVPMEASTHKPQRSGCKRQLRGTVKQSLQNGTCKHMQISVHSEINTAPKAVLTLRIVTSDRQQSVSTQRMARLAVHPESFSCALGWSSPSSWKLFQAAEEQQPHYANCLKHKLMRVFPSYRKWK